MYQNTTKLMAWQMSHQLVLEVYKLTKTFPKEEQYGLTSQTRRAAVSIPSNIVEGKARESTKEFIRFLMISRSSLEELKYQMYLARDLNYITEDVYNQLEIKMEHTGKLIGGLINKMVDKM